MVYSRSFRKEIADVRTFFLALACCLMLTPLFGSSNTPPPASPADSSAYLRTLALTQNFSLGAPQQVQPTPDGTAVLFLRSGPRDRVLRLFEMNTQTQAVREVLSPETLLGGKAETLSVAERARRERARQVLRGFTSFALSEDGTRLLLPFSGKLYVVRRSDAHVTALAGEGWLDARFSPDGTRVAAVKDNELFVIDLAGGQVRQLTHGASDTLTHGVAEFVAQEEMDRFSGFWWSPDGHSLAYEEADLSPVQTLYIPDPTNPADPPNAFRYPRAGTPNARVRLGVISQAGGPTVWAKWDSDKYPYLARVAWKQASAPLTLLVLTRRQQDAQVLAVDAQSGTTRTLVAEHDPAWINLERNSFVPHWLTGGQQFLWSTERSGEWQLELHDKSGALVRALTPPGFRYAGVEDVDEADGTVTVAGGPDARERQLYRVPLAGGALSLISAGRGVHTAVFAKNHAVYAEGYSGLDGTRTVTLRRANGEAVAVLPSIAEQPTRLPNLELTQAVTATRTFDAAILRPHNFDPQKKYPVLVSVYAGPTVKVVQSVGRAYLEDQWFADQGFIVVSLDGRGTPGKGRDWERAVAGNLIDIALEDQVAGVQALGRAHPEMDMSRVGISGWSFGGYFAAMATIRRPDVFACGIAGGTVTDWREYDTCYTERYLGLPSENPAGYDKSSVLTYAAGLQKPLLLIHGITDDNVYFVNTLKLVEKLYEAGRPFELLPLTGTHLAGASDPEQNVLLHQRMLSFLQTHLGSAHAAR